MKTLLAYHSALIQLFLIFNVNSFSQTASWWPQKSQTLSNLRNINFSDNNTGWFFGDSTAGATFKFGLIKKTTNQGQNWTLQTLGSNNIQIFSSYALSATTVIAVGRFQTSGNGAVIKTSNGGLSWSMDTTSIPQRLYDVDFVTPSNGWVVGKNGYLATTTNGGLSWSAQTTGTVQNLYSIDFVDMNNGWAVGVSSTIIHSSNGGLTYFSQPCPVSGDLFAVYAFSASKAIAVGQGGNMVMTTNGGTTWSPINSGTTNDLLDVTFVDPLNGWAVGTGGTMVRSSDGGLTWTSQVSGTANDINSISMRSTGLGWYCGLNGTVEYYGTSPAGIHEHYANINTVNVYPNPMMEKATIEIIRANIDSWNLNLFDISGKKVLAVTNINSSSYLFTKENLLPGVYLYNANTKEGTIAQGKIIIK